MLICFAVFLATAVACSINPTNPPNSTVVCLESCLASCDAGYFFASGVKHVAAECTDDGAAWVAALAAEMGIAPLAAHGLTPALIPELVAKAQASSSMQGNSLPLSDAELAAILHLAL